MNTNSQAVGELDQPMVAKFWDAEWIFREADAKTFVVFPREPHDEAIAAGLGARIVPHLSKPVLIWRNDDEQN